MYTRHSSYRRHGTDQLFFGGIEPVNLVPPFSAGYSHEANDLFLSTTFHSDELALCLKDPVRVAGCNLSQRTDRVESPKVISLDRVITDRVIRDEIVRKMSSCVSFYGNFVIIPASTDMLKKIMVAIRNVKLDYWPDIMAFIDSYDLPFTSAEVRKLIDELVNEITRFVEAERIDAVGWQKLLCTLPDDTTTRMDYRLKSGVIEEVNDLAEAGRLPFDLSQPIRQLLESAKKHAAEYIRSD